MQDGECTKELEVKAWQGELGANGLVQGARCREFGAKMLVSKKRLVRESLADEARQKGFGKENLAKRDLLEDIQRRGFDEEVLIRRIRQRGCRGDDSAKEIQWRGFCRESSMNKA